MRNPTLRPPDDERRELSADAAGWCFLLAFVLCVLFGVLVVLT